MGVSPISVSDDLIREQAYIVSRGVRPLALIDEFPAESLDMLRVATRLDNVSDGCIPFVIDHGDGTASCGFAASAWAIDLYRWLRTSQEVPAVHCHQMMGLLLGYDSDAISRFAGWQSGRRFTVPTVSVARAAK
jgi:hypothetical protein